MNKIINNCKKASFPIEAVRSYNGLIPGDFLANATKNPLWEQHIMRILFTNSTLNIKTGTTVSGISNQPETLNVMKGRVWVTVEGSPDDYWLGKGDSLAIEAGRLVVIEAVKMDSQIYLPQTQEVKTQQEVRRVFDFFTSFSANPWKAAPGEQLIEVSDVVAEPALAPAAGVQIGYTDGLCQQRNLQAAPACPA